MTENLSQHTRALKRDTRALKRGALAAVCMLATCVMTLTGCGSEDASSNSASTSSTTESSTMSDKPVVTVPDTPAPTTLQIKDITVGSGEEAKTGDTVSVQYVGVAYSTKKEFDASYNRGEPFSFKLGAGDVIAGWDEGVVGMKVGGRRELIIPPDKGYGARGAGGVIGPNETLIFVVDLESIS